MSNKTLIEISKIAFTSDKQTTENIQIGCLQRMAAASESQAESAKAMAKNINDLQYWKDHYKKRAEELTAELKSVTKSRDIYKGLYKKAKTIK
jgi:pantothenate kinase type III